MLNGENGGLLSVLTLTAEKTVALLQQTRTLEHPVSQGNITAVPLSKVSVGFAAGGNVQTAKNGAEPAGAGSKVTKTPVGVLVFQPENIQNPVQLLVPENTGENGVTQSVQTLTAVAKKLFKK